MVTRSHGYRIGTRKKLRKKVREKGKFSIANALRSYEIGEKVAIKVEPSYHKGMPHKRFFGKIGRVIEKRGKSYLIEVKVGDTFKKIICSPIHLRKV